MGIKVELDYTRQQIKQELIDNGISPTKTMLDEIIFRMTTDARNVANSVFVDCIVGLKNGETLTPTIADQEEQAQ